MNFLSTFTFVFFMGVFFMGLSSAMAQEQTDPDNFPIPEQSEPKIYEKSKHKNWIVQCMQKNGIEICTLSQILKNLSGGSIAELNIEILSEESQARAGVTFISPLATLLPPQIGWKIDDHPKLHYPFTWCEELGCISRFGLTHEDVVLLQKGSQLSIEIYSLKSPNTPVQLPVSLSGFTAAWNEVTGGTSTGATSGQ